MSTAQRTSPLDPGSRIGDFQIIAPLKSGGMATLFLGRKVGPAGFARPVAIKVVHAHLAVDQSFVEMFLDEARLSASIRHPNVVHVEALGQTQGIYYLVMEYVHGCTLQQFVQKLGRQGRRLTPELAAYIAMKVADGLHAAHEAKNDRGETLGVVHRDVSPQNILLGYDGHVKLIDFGVAKAKGRSNETSGGSLKGKIRYMPPEQAWGREVDRRADVYALGIVLWESLSFRRLFDGDNDFQILEAVRHPSPTKPSAYAEGVSQALDEAVMTSLAPSVEERFQTAQAMRRALGIACPGALQVEPDDLAALLAIVMADDIQKTRETLPEELSSVLARNTVGTGDSLAVQLDEFTRIGEVPPSFMDGDEPRNDPGALPSSSRIIPSSPSGHATPQGRMWLWAVAVSLGLTFGGIAIAVAIATRPDGTTQAAAQAEPSAEQAVAEAVGPPTEPPGEQPTELSGEPTLVPAPTAPASTDARADGALARGVSPPPEAARERAHVRAVARRETSATSVSRDNPEDVSRTTSMRSQEAPAPTSRTATTTMRSAAGPIIDSVEF